MRQQFTPPVQLDDAEWLRSQYATRSLQDIADELGVHRNTVRNRLIALGIDRRNKMSWVVGKPKSDEQKRKMSDARKTYWQRHDSTEERARHRLKVSKAKTKTGTKQGRPYVYVLGRGYIAQHVLVAEAKIGRPLAKGEEVHHKDGDITNNAPGNLDVLTRSEHAKLHNEQRTRSVAGRFVKGMRHGS